MLEMPVFFGINRVQGRFARKNPKLGAHGVTWGKVRGSG